MTYHGDFFYNGVLRRPGHRDYDVSALGKVYEFPFDEDDNQRREPGLFRKSYPPANPTEDRNSWSTLNEKLLYSRVNG